MAFSHLLARGPASRDKLCEPHRILTARQKHPDSVKMQISVSHPRKIESKRGASNRQGAFFSSIGNADGRPAEPSI